MSGSNDESQPLLLRQHTATKLQTRSFFTPLRRMLLIVFSLSFTFGLTNTPMVYAYRSLTCQEYYRHHGPYKGDGDECAIRAVDIGTAKAISVMVTATTIAGVLNLLTTGYLQKTYGLKLTLLAQSIFPLFRNAGQIVGLWYGGTAGIWIFQATQWFAVLGGGAGYLLSANTFVGAVVEPKDRTGSFGQLQGVAMAGTALAFTVGGILNDFIDPTAPFYITLALLFLCTLLTFFTLPYIHPKYTEGKKDKRARRSSHNKGWREQVNGFFRPLRVFKRRRLERWGGDGYYGVTLLAIGTFVSVLATAYVPLMLQLIATNNYGFKPTQNGYLMSTFAIVRATFLTFAFPSIISFGRKWYESKQTPRSTGNPGSSASSISGQKPGFRRGVSYSYTSSRPTRDEEDETSSDESDEDETGEYKGHGKESEHHSAFDLDFLRWSCLFDAVGTAVMAFSSKSWQMYIAGALLPLFSAAAPAAKGVVMEMVTASERPEALAGVALIELLATVICQSVFGGLFALLSQKGHSNMIFLANGMTALLSTVILLFARLPPSPEEVDDARSERGTDVSDWE